MLSLLNRGGLNLSKLKAGILGAGFMGKLHAENLIKLNKRVNLVAICSRPLSTASDLNEEVLGGAGKVYKNFDNMLAENSLDILYVCLPPFAHQGQVEKAASEGINIFIEKPIALKLSRGQSMVRAIEKNKVNSQVGYHYRFSKPVGKLKQEIKNGVAGRPTLFQGKYFCNSLHSDWWRHLDKSGGQIFEQIIHLYDLAFYLFGDVEQVSAFKNNLCHQDIDDYSVEDTSTAILNFKSGAMGSIVGSNCAVPNQWQAGLSVVCENLTVNFLSPEKAEFIYYENGQVKDKKIIEEENDLYYLETEDFVNSILNDYVTGASIEEGLYGLKIVSAIVKSANQDGKKICVNEM